MNAPCGRLRGSGWGLGLCIPVAVRIEQSCAELTAADLWLTPGFCFPDDTPCNWQPALGKGGGGNFPVSSLVYFVANPGSGLSRNDNSLDFF